jgi:two-component system, OmpR family, heavy metal sensor histidine kinase CusS
VVWAINWKQNLKARRFTLYRVSLAARVTALIGVAFVVCVLTLGVVIQQSIVEHFAEQDGEEYEVMGASVVAVLRQDLGPTSSEEFQSRMRGAVTGHHGVFFGVFDQSGNAIYVMDGPDLGAIAMTVNPTDRVDPDNLHEWSEGDEVYRGVVLSVPSGDGSNLSEFRVVLASDMGFHAHFLEDFQIMLWRHLFAALLVVLLAAWIAVRIGHKPLHQISQRIGSLTTEQLNERLDPSQVPSDLVDLVNSFNVMVERMEDLFQRLANVSTDIAHELRTPITNLTTQTQVALGQVRDAEEYRELLYSNLEEFERMANMINEMLWLARSDNGLLKPTFEVIEPQIEIEALFEYMDAWAEERNVALRLTGHCPAIEGDRAMLRRTFSNLLTNAIRHAEENSCITVELSEREHFTDITFKNKGDDIPKDDIPRIFDRFYRVDRSRQRGDSSSGTGLGLAIVYSIITAHGGSVSVSSHNRKTSFQLSLPSTTS